MIYRIIHHKKQICRLEIPGLNLHILLIFILNCNCQEQPRISESTRVKMTGLFYIE